MQEVLIFSAIAAGKRADFARRRTAALLEILRREAVSIAGGSHFGRLTPFDLIHLVGRRRLSAALRRAVTGNYRKLARCLPRLAEFDPRGCTLEELEAVPGIGPKTARMFLLHTRPGQRFAVLDTHVLRFMRKSGFSGVPRSTPSGKAYARLEREWLARCDAVGIRPDVADSSVWRMMRLRPDH